MKMMLQSGKLLLLDMASTLFFLLLYLMFGKIPLAVALGMALGVAQIGWQKLRQRPIDTMQWLSLFLVLASGTTTLITQDPRFVMIKPSVIYAIVGVVMLKPGWINRYLPPIALELVPDIALILGFAWAGLMFFSAALNVVIALNFSVATWSISMSIYGVVSKAALFLAGFVAMRTIAIRRRRAQFARLECPPTIDQERGLVYAVNFNPRTDTIHNDTDALIAMDIKTGGIRWKVPLLKHSNDMTGYPGAPNPAELESAPGGYIKLQTQKGGKHRLVVGLKSGDVYALDPDADGQIICHQRRRSAPPAA